MLPSTPAGRLRHVRAATGLQQEDFGLRIGVSKAAISRWETGSAEVTPLAAMAIEYVYGIRFAWLMLGEEPMQAQLQNTGSGSALMLPVLDGLPSCGPSGEIHDLAPNADRQPFRRGLIQEVLRQCGAGSESTLFAARVQGDSMSPTIQPGDMVLVNTALPLRVEPRKGALHLVRTTPDTQEARIKRVHISPDGRYMNLISENEAAYPLEPVPLDGVPVQDLVIGRVCWYERILGDLPSKPKRR
ncbi:helix-turn-helix transcriptional regulator [Geothrix sp. PMB-07]|uniref:LexA family transcriptional regulator n=1 Tax=Geothrix sp. PMB-07 TaxID=3068640 RepID=UPI0035581F9F